MFMCCAKLSSVINLIYSGQQVFSYTGAFGTLHEFLKTLCANFNNIAIFIALKWMDFYARLNQVHHFKARQTLDRIQNTIKMV
jgi:hypothetical protein